ncbi:MAG: uracil-DNA glycosylase [Candidatus Terraquivivens tikiterensis]|uniref:Type-5 uracil-DNA glycosylase n=1 Tax=Candidatus Terraquivivens tikiterensis TaxID=1980982 RepID=A0A2R7Y9Y8_9ARCH|nr:MAG: uracil-DNA glycosylase [Candidatus Terraquivivens tikiterensis]
MLSSLEELANTIVSCNKCPRLVYYRSYVAEKRPRRFLKEEYWAKPIPGFGDPNARLLVVGLAPAAHGGNRTGRMFTGDGSAETLMRALYSAGYASQPYSIHKDDGLRLEDAYLTAVVRCVPPKNMPSKEEIENCSTYLKNELFLLKNVRVIVALGMVAFKACIKNLSELGVKMPRPLPEFSHGAIYKLEGELFSRAAPVLIASYHPSRQNTQTGRLTQGMLNRVFKRARRLASV